MSKSLSYDDFRGIAISPIVSKVFEYFWTDLGHYIIIYFLRRIINLVLKKDSGCNNAIYTFRKVVDSYVTRGRPTTANICSIDLSKAFDKVIHYSLFVKLIINKLFPVQLLDIIVKLFSDCVSCVKWDGVYSSMFVITSGARQASYFVYE